MFAEKYFGALFSCKLRSFGMRSSVQCGVHDNREAVLLMATYFIPQYPSKKYQLHSENMLKQRNTRASYCTTLETIKPPFEATKYKKTESSYQILLTDKTVESLAAVTSDHLVTIWFFFS